MINLLEHFLGFRISFIFVRMIFDSQFSISFFNVFFRGTRSETKNFVQIRTFFAHTDGEGEELGEVVAVAVVVLVVAASLSGGAMYPGRWAAHAEWHVSMASPTTA